MATTKRRYGTYDRSALNRRSRPEPRARILIVCEGAKTEPTYFQTLRERKGLTREEVTVLPPERGTHPRNVVEYARELQVEARDGGLPYHQVWCVFDRDDHLKIHEAHIRARDCGIHVAFSNPCFELWFLAHFRYSTAHVERDDAERELRNHVPGYAKSTDVYEALVGSQQAAFGHAARLRKHHAAVNGDRPENPSTSVDLLVQELNALAER